MLRHGQCFDPSTNLHASDFYTILGYIRSGHPLYKVRKKAGIRKEQSLHFSEQIDPFSGCHNLSSPYVKAAHVVHFSGLQIRGFFCITSPTHQGGSKNRHQPQNKNCRVFGRMFANISPSCRNAFPHGALVSNSQKIIVTPTFGERGQRAATAVQRFQQTRCTLDTSYQWQDQGPNSGCEMSDIRELVTSAGFLHIFYSKSFKRSWSAACCCIFWGQRPVSGSPVHSQVGVPLPKDFKLQTMSCAVRGLRWLPVILEYESLTNMDDINITRYSQFQCHCRNANR